MIEINFDGIIGPSHNYAGLSLGNIASTTNQGLTAYPREAALQGIAKMRHNVELGLVQGVFPPQRRPNRAWLGALGVENDPVPEALRPPAFSASAMWAANAATASPAPDTADGRCHLTVANLKTMAHRSHEWHQTLAQLRLAFADAAHFAVHEPIPPAYGDEGAANHMRLSDSHASPGVEVFVYGVSGGPFPARQHVEASRAVARLHRLDPERTIFVAQSEAAIAAGAFHNDVVAVSNEHVLFAHEQAFEDKDAFFEKLHQLLPSVEIIEVPANLVSLEDAIRSYVFNAQLVTRPDGTMALILPQEARETENVWAWLNELVRGNGPIRHLDVVDVRQSMANGGGPACLRLRVVAEPAHVDPRFLADIPKLDALAACVARHWPERIAPADLAYPELSAELEKAREALLRLLELDELI